jgi:hypothetical protein
MKSLKPLDAPPGHHPCDICGNMVAPFGIKGTWLCHEHWCCLPAAVSITIYFNRRLAESDEKDQAV